jgi:ABC-2 type transport system permease protein
METAASSLLPKHRLRPAPRYWSIFTMSIQQSIAYRGRTILSLVGNLAWVLMLYYLWKTIYVGTGAIQGFDWIQMRTYILLSYAINILLTWSNSTRIAGAIRTGEIVQDIMRPMDFLLMHLAITGGASVIEGGLSALFTLGLGFLVSGILPPASVPAFGLFLISIVIGFLIKFLVNFITSLGSFYTISSTGLFWSQNAIINLFSGVLIPLAFFPDWLRTLSEWLPFQGIVYTPVMIYLGKLGGLDLLKAIGVQAAWVVILWSAARLFWKKAFRALEIQGG